MRQRYNEAKLKEKEKEAAKSIFVPKMQDLDVFLMGDLGDSDEGSGALE